MKLSKKHLLWSATFVTQVRREDSPGEKKEKTKPNQATRRKPHSFGYL